MRLVARFAAAAFSLAVSLAALALPATAQTIFANDGTIGLVPPDGMMPVPGVPGFQDPAAKASILVLEMPKPAYAEITTNVATKELEKQGVTVEERRDLTLADGVPAVLLKGFQTVGAGALKKWILIAGGKDQTGMITVQFPEAAASRYPDAKVEAALKTVVFRAPPSPEEMLAKLPFTLDQLSGYQVMKVIGSNAVLLTKPDADKPAGEGKDAPQTQSFFIVAVGPGDIREEEREAVAKRAIASVPGIKELRVERGGPLRVGGQPGYELIANAVDQQTGQPVKVAQWLSFGRNGYLRMVGVAPAQTFEADYTAMRAVRDGVTLR
ncbi:hypothetical protein [Ancylobacter sp. IITR112]|uniref:hypothetical protein n=1 Tax=Ancylobacter sp. IITR112 TaxID=3138073 RepID=UPI00352BC11D